MKTLTLISIIALLLSSASCQTISPVDISKLEIDITVLDEETGKPIEGVTASGGFAFLGPNKTNPNYKSITDSNGKATVSGKFPRQMSVHAVGEDWYAGGLTPQPPLTKQERSTGYAKREATIKLRKKKSPIGLVSKVAGVRMPSIGDTHGFDLLIGDWVPPHGKGKISDVYFSTSKKITSTKIYESKLTITFPNDNGIIQDKVWINNSEFKTSYQASTNANYLNKLIIDFSRKEGDSTIGRAKDKNYIFRIRTIKEGNKIKSAYYGTFKQEFSVGVGTLYPDKCPSLYFGYLINPTPNDTNLEQDSKIRVQTVQPQEL